ncbi:ion transporter [Xylaria bambusicola]|uniref:ion transporter n=1 Tax=Xylaria bambusicola TaxID=326684 RepID=UPI002007B73F|nr:ion transporter [Xylaria bambusicola]KAI0515331.1 ion transporter [Xylaria bambusicola]
MPVRVRSVAMPRERRHSSPPHAQDRGLVELPNIAYNDSFRDVIKKISSYITQVIHAPATFEQLRTTSAGDGLHNLVEYLSVEVTNPAIVNALLALKWHYGTISDGRGLSDARANACEIVAWRFLTRLSEREIVDFCLYEIPDPSERDGGSVDEECAVGSESDEQTALLRGAGASSAAHHRRPSVINEVRRGSVQRRSQLFESVSKLTMSRHATETEEDSDSDPTAPFIHLNALEIAAIADAKRFLSQHIVQQIITGIWNGEIIFWDRLTAKSGKKPSFYNHNTADPYSRLRVPKYLKAYEVAFFCAFLLLYYGVLIQQNRYGITRIEILLYIWFAAFLYDEVSEYIDAGSIFYAADVWNVFDMAMIAIGIVYFVLRCVGLYRKDYQLVDIAFDVLALEALFMVPRVFSLLSLSPYWGTLIPCLKAMGLDFLKFMVFVAVLYLGFLTTFSLVGRETFTFPHMAMIVTKIFFGASFVGFDNMHEIDPIFGPPLMFIFVTLSSILLMGSLTGMLSNSFSRVITHAREEYLYIYSVYVLEASTSNRLTHFYPPFNLLALIIFRPLRLVASGTTLRHGRIVLLRATHAPIVALIQAYEWIAPKLNLASANTFRGPQQIFSKRHIVPPPSRPQSSYRPYIPSPRPESARFTKQKWGDTTEDDTANAPTDVEARIADLSAKIDRLTALVASLQPTTTPTQQWI